jgi:UDP:flavonoid glycosyltransferase YjiC (YdhE family)
MKTIFFAWELGANYGHIASIAPVARALKAMGHRCIIAAQTVRTAFATHDPPFDMILPAPLSRKRRIAGPTLTYSQLCKDGGFDDADELAALTWSWLAMINLARPDMIVAEHAPVALLAAAIANIPCAQLGSGFMVPPRSTPMAAMLPLSKASLADRAAADAQVEDILRQSCAALGVPGYDNFAALLATAEEYVQSWPELDHYGPQPGRHYYGPMLGFAGAASVDWPLGEGSRVFAYLPGDVRDRELMVDALRLLGWPTVLHGGDAPSDLPAHMLFSATAVDMAQMGAEADVFINHGGHGTVAAALRFGKPQLLLPSTFERSMLAFRAVQAGLAVVPQQEEPSAAQLARLLETTHKTGLLTASCAHIAARYASYDPRAAACELAEDLLQQIA